MTRASEIETEVRNARHLVAQSDRNAHILLQNPDFVSISPRMNTSNEGFWSCFSILQMNLGHSWLAWSSRDGLLLERISEAL